MKKMIFGGSDGRKFPEMAKTPKKRGLDPKRETLRLFNPEKVRKIDPWEIFSKPWRKEVRFDFSWFWVENVIFPTLGAP